MPGLPLGTIFEVSIQGEINNQRTLNVLHYRTISVSNDSSVAGEQFNIAQTTNALGNLVPKLKVCTANVYTIKNIVVQAIRLTRYARTVFPIGESGNIAGAVNTPNIAATITKRTELSGRWAVGSFHLAGLPSTKYDNGLLTEDYLDLIQPFAEQLLENIEPAGTTGIYQPIIYHPDGTHLGYTNLVGVEVQPQVRVMRRRTVGLGI